MRSNAWPERALAVLVACSLEGAWLELAYVTVQGITGRSVAIPILAFAAAALTGLAFGRMSARDPRLPYRPVLGLLVIGAGVLGWLVPLGSAAGGLLGAPVATLQLNLAGPLLGVAVLRGAAHVALDDDERIARRALGPGLALVGGLWLLLTASGATREPAIVDAAFTATVTFVTAGLLSIGLARLADPDGGSDVAVRRRTWTGLLVGVVAALLVVALPLALIVGVPAQSAVRGVLGPVAEVLIAVAALAVIPLGLVAAILVQAATFLRDTFDIGRPGAIVGQLADQLRRLLGGSAGDGPSLGVLPALLALLVAILVLRALLRRSDAALVGGHVTETRELERPVLGPGLRRPRLRVPRRRGAPRTASEAYLASLDLLGHVAGSERLEWETPSEHARRLRDDAVGPALGRLAADYVLAEFGLRTLPDAEHRRAIERWRQIRAALGR